MCICVFCVCGLRCVVCVLCIVCVYGGYDELCVCVCVRVCCVCRSVCVWGSLRPTPLLFVALRWVFGSQQEDVGLTSFPSPRVPHLLSLPSARLPRSLQPAAPREAVRV